MTMYWLGVFQFLSNFFSLGLEADYIQHTTYSASSDKGRSISILYSVFIANFSVVACYSFFATRTHLISREGTQTAEEDERSFGAAPSTKDLLPTAVTAALHQY